VHGCCDVWQIEQLPNKSIRITRQREQRPDQHTRSEAAQPQRPYIEQRGHLVTKAWRLARSYTHVDRISGPNGVATSWLT
jgi:hypothetical protein